MRGAPKFWRSSLRPRAATQSQKNEASLCQGIAFRVPFLKLALSNEMSDHSRKNAIKKQQLAKIPPSQRGGKVDVLLVSKINLLVNLFS